MRVPGPEESFQQSVINLARICGWRVAHFRKSRTARGWRTAVAADGAGWPDLFLVHPASGRALARELKVPPNETTCAQEAWLALLRAAGIDARVWTPDDWKEVQETLSGC